MSTSPKAPAGSANRGSGGAPRLTGGSAPPPGPRPKAAATDSSGAAKPKADSLAPPSTEALSIREMETVGEDPAPPVGRKLLESLPFFQVEAAPYDPRVPPLPSESDPPPSAPPEQANASGLFDIRSMLSLETNAAQRGGSRPDDDPELVNLSGGLFAGGGPAPMAPPVLSPVADVPVVEAEPAPVPAAPAPRPAPPAPSPSRPTGKFAPVISAASMGPVSERRASAKELEAAKRSARIGWVVALVAGGAAILMLGMKLGQVFAPGSGAQPATSASTGASATAPEVAPSNKLDLAPPPKRAEEPSVDDSSARPKTPGDAEKPVAAGALGSAKPLGGPWPKSTATAAAGEPATPTPAATATAAAAEPSGGVEFNTGAARTALAMAAGMAAACKQPDDSGGGAKVSVTFAPSGRVTSSKVVSPPFQGTPTGGCIANAFRSVTVPPFDGAPVTVTKDVTIR